MIDLDNLEEIKKLDKSNIRDSVGGFADQVEQTLEEFEKLKPPENYQNIKNILLIGMGGSTYGGRIIKTLYAGALKVPFDVASDYRIPNYINEESLVIAVSYSGNTEETVTSLEKAHLKGAKILGLTCHDQSNLGSFCKLNKIPYWVLEPKFNPSGQPRTASGYMTLGPICLLEKLGFIALSEEQIKNTISLLKDNLESLKIETRVLNNSAKKLALKYFIKNIILVGAEFLEGTLYPLRNPIHETGKNFATYFPIPDLNHHLLESLPNPSSNKENFLYVFLESEFYSGPIKRRIELTKEVIEKNEINVEIIKLEAKSEFAQIFEAIQLNGFIAFYLALLNGVDPAVIPWVTYFQETFRRK